MKFTVCVDKPAYIHEAWVFTVPIFSINGYNCYSATDSEGEIEEEARAVITSMLEVMFEDGMSITRLESFFNTRQAGPEFEDCDKTIEVEVDFVVTASFENTVVYSDNEVTEIENLLMETPASRFKTLNRKSDQDLDSMLDRLNKIQSINDNLIDIEDSWIKILPEDENN